MSTDQVSKAQRFTQDLDLLISLHLLHKLETVWIEGRTGYVDMSHAQCDPSYMFLMKNNGATFGSIAEHVESICTSHGLDQIVFIVDDDKHRGGYVAMQTQSIENQHWCLTCSHHNWMLPVSKHMSWQRPDGSVIAPHVVPQQQRANQASGLVA